VGEVTTKDQRHTVDMTDMTVYHLLSLKLLSRLHPADEHIARHLLSNVVFNVDFLRLVVLYVLQSTVYPT